MTRSRKKPPTTNGVRALARTLRPDAITLDILLPDRHGHEVLALLKVQPEMEGRGREALLHALRTIARPVAAEA